MVICNRLSYKDMLNMKKICAILFFVFVSSTLAYATENVKVNEIKLEPTSLPMVVKEKPKTDPYDELEKAKQEEMRQQDLYNQSQDYMYRLQQQMSTPTRMNSFGGYSF